MPSNSALNFALAISSSAVGKLEIISAMHRFNDAYRPEA